MELYREKHIDLDKLLTLDFGKGHSHLVESGQEIRKLEELNNVTILVNKPFWGTRIRYKQEWNDVKGIYAFNYKKYHTITINMDPSMRGYENNLSLQKCKLFDLIRSYQNKIKYLVLVYEHGRSNKLHWHMLINIQSVKEFEEALQKEFGKGRAVCVKKVQENSNETLEQNLCRIVDYFKKEEHNKHRCLICKY